MRKYFVCYFIEVEVVDFVVGSFFERRRGESWDRSWGRSG